MTLGSGDGRKDTDFSSEIAALNTGPLNKLHYLYKSFKFWGRAAFLLRADGKRPLHRVVVRVKLRGGFNGGNEHVIASNSCHFHAKWRGES